MVVYNLLEMESPAEATRLTGQVKWFNNKSGFGFITVCDGQNAQVNGKDIFVHFSSVQVSDTQYRYLIQGEYVDFELRKPEKGNHEFHAVNVSGVKGGSLMCETRRVNQDNRPYEPRVYKTPSAKEDGFTPVNRRRPKKVAPSGVSAAEPSV